MNILLSFLVASVLNGGPRAVTLPDPCRPGVVFATTVTESGSTWRMAATARAQAKRCAPVAKTVAKPVARKPLVSPRTHASSFVPLVKCAGSGTFLPMAPKGYCYIP